MSETPVFEYTGMIAIKGRGVAYIGPAPFDFGDDTIGRTVLVDGKERTISSFERWSRMLSFERWSRMPRKGEMTSLLFEPPRAA